MISRDEFEELLNEMYKPIEVCGVTIQAGTALRACDPVAFNIELAQYRMELEQEEDTPDPYIAYVGEKPTAEELAEGDSDV
jgi:hypothetical protein